MHFKIASFAFESAPRASNERYVCIANLDGDLDLQVTDGAGEDDDAVQLLVGAAVVGLAGAEGAGHGVDGALDGVEDGLGVGGVAGGQHAGDVGEGGFAVLRVVHADLGGATGEQEGGKEGEGGFHVQRT